MAIPKLVLTPMPKVLKDDRLPLDRMANYEYEKAHKIVFYALLKKSPVIYEVSYSVTRWHCLEFYTELFGKDEKDRAFGLAGRHGVYVQEYNFGHLKTMSHDEMVETFKDKPFYEFIAELWKDLQAPDMRNYYAEN